MDEDLIVPVTIYDKISDDMYTLSRNIIVRFNVALSRNYNNERQYYYKEYEYSSKYVDQKSLVTIRRSFDFYISIENIFKEEFTGIKEYVMITITEMPMLLKRLEEVISWFTSEKYNGLYATKNNKLIMLGKLDPIIIDNLPMGKYIRLEATTADFKNGSAPAVRLSLNSLGHYADLPVDKIVGLHYVLSTTSMYQCAQEMVNFIGKPDYGTNLVYFENNTRAPTVEIEKTDGRSGRKIKPKSKKEEENQFDKFDKLV